MVTEVKNNRTPMEIAKAELAEELSKKSVKLLKDKLRELDKAETIVCNIKREIEDLEQQITDGNI